MIENLPVGRSQDGPFTGERLIMSWIELSTSCVSEEVVTLFPEAPEQVRPFSYVSLIVSDVNIVQAISEASVTTLFDASSPCQILG